MSDMVERVAKAIAECPQVWAETREDGYEELYRYGGSGDAEFVLLARIHPADDFDSARADVVNKMRARAAIEAMREPVTRMLNAAIDTHPFELGDIGPLGFRMSPQKLFAECWRAMIDAALQQPQASKGEGE